MCRCTRFLGGGERGKLRANNQDVIRGMGEGKRNARCREELVAGCSVKEYVRGWELQSG